MKPPTFSASLLRLTGEGEQLTIAVTGSTAAELEKRIGAADEIAQSQLKRANTRVLRVAEAAGAEVDTRFARAVRALCIAIGVPIPDEYAAQEPSGNGRDAQEGGDPDADPDRATDPPADP